MRLLSLCVGLVGCGVGSSGGLNESMLGEAAPEFVVTDSTGGELRLSEQRGTPVFVDFSAMWCSTCQKQAPETEVLFETYGEDAVVWTVLFQNAEGDAPGPGDLDAWTAEFGLEHPVLADDDAESAYSAYGSGRQPLGVVIDAEGIISWMGEGSDVASQGANALSAVIP